ncbi:cytochrome c [Aciduricibacillus chroicocephali]|uniref:Cytochrome c n=1 Tax=Aciduricibacillus chroicocephali TaxID=3054939 RepID=A0ABY9KT43_9BACI|nr:cytochrome c [Bacillaceae bacterium 44XB]
MKKWLMAIVFGSALVLGACGNDDSDSKEKNNNNKTETSKPATPGESKVDSAKAEELFSNNCASCHAQDLSGGAGPSLKNIGSQLSESEIKKIIEKGRGGMPGFKGNLADGDISILSTWLAEHK